MTHPLKQRRMEFKLTLKQAAAKIGKTPETFRRYETNERQPDRATLAAIHHEFGIDPNTFFNIPPAAPEQGGAA